MSKQYDAVVIGGGHNGLVAAFYLARAGFDVCVLERFHTVGGAAFSEEIEGAPGHIASTGSYVLSLAPQKILSDLDVWEHGLELVSRNPRSFTPYPDGSYLVGWEDRERYKQDLARFSPNDANALDHFSDFVARGAEIMDRYILRQPPSWAEFAAEFNRPGDQHVFQKLFIGSVADLAEYFFDHPYTQGAIAGGGLIGTFRGPREAGTAYNKLYLSMGMATGKRGAWSYVRGAMGSVSRAFGDAARLKGVEVRTNVEVERVLVRDGRAIGVATASGEEISAKIVLSNADPKRTYLTLVERSELPEQYLRDIEAIQIDSPVMKINLAIEELPRFTALDGPEADYTWGYNGGLMISPSIDYLESAFQDARAGHPSDFPLMNIHCQSAVDRSVAPEGKHTMSIFAQFYPYELAEGTWESRREEIARHVIKRLAEYAPNIEDKVIAMQALGPPDIEERFGLTGGHIYQGELVPEQALDMRPVPGSTSYQGPIHGLYLCGSGAWPGGCVMGAPGHNAAHEAITRLTLGEYN